MVFPSKSGAKDAGGCGSRNSVQVNSVNGSEDCRLSKQIKDIEESLHKFEKAVESLKTQISQIETWKEELSEKLECCKQKLSKRSKDVSSASFCATKIKEEPIDDETYQDEEASPQTRKRRNARNSRIGSSVSSQSPSPNTNWKSSNGVAAHSSGTYQVLYSRSPWYNRTENVNRFTKEMLLASLDKLKTIEAKTTKGTGTIYRCVYCSHSFNQKGNGQRHICKAHFNFSMTCKHCKEIFYDDVLLVNPICSHCSVAAKEEAPSSFRSSSFINRTSTAAPTSSFRTSNGGGIGNRKRSMVGDCDSDIGSGVERNFNEDSLGFDSQETKNPIVFIAGISPIPCLPGGNGHENGTNLQEVRSRVNSRDSIKEQSRRTSVPTATSSSVASTVLVHNRRPGSSSSNTESEMRISSDGNGESSNIDCTNIIRACIEKSQASRSTENLDQSELKSQSEKEKNGELRGAQSTSTCMESCKIVVNNAFPNFDLKRALSVSVAVKRVSVPPNYSAARIEAEAVQNSPINRIQDKPKRIIKKRRLSEFITGDYDDLVDVGATEPQKGNFKSKKAPLKKKASSASLSKAAGTMGTFKSRGLTGRRNAASTKSLTPSASTTSIKSPAKSKSASNLLSSGSEQTPKRTKSRQIGQRPRKIQSPDITSLVGRSAPQLTPVSEKKKGKPRKILTSELNLTYATQSEKGTELPPALVNVSGTRNDLTRPIIPATVPPYSSNNNIDSAESALQPVETVSDVTEYSIAEEVADAEATSVGEFGCPLCCQRFESSAEATMHRLESHDGSSTKTIQLGFADVQENYQPVEPVMESSGGLVPVSTFMEPIYTVASDLERNLSVQTTAYPNPITTTAPRSALLPVNLNLNVSTETESECIPSPLTSTSVSVTNDTDGGITLHRNYEQLVVSECGSTIIHECTSTNDDGLSSTTTVNSIISGIPTVSVASVSSSVSEFESTMRCLSPFGNSSSDPGLGVGIRSSLMISDFATEMATIPMPLGVSLGSYDREGVASMECLMDMNGYQEVVPMPSGAVAVPVPIEISSVDSYNEFGTYTEGGSGESRFIPDIEEEIEAKVLPRDPNFIVWEGFCPDASFSEIQSQGTLRLGRDGIEKLPNLTHFTENS